MCNLCDLPSDQMVDITNNHFSAFIYLKDAFEKCWHERSEDSVLAD